MAFLLPWLRRGFTSAHAERIFRDLLGYPDITNLEDRQFELSEREMLKLCKAAREALLQEPALLELPRFEGDTVLVGDLHGQFGDLQAIFAAIGQPGPARRYIFLGDYVDRGECGLEIVAVLFALKLRYPEHVYLLRGNHECTEITVMFGFCMECQRRSTLAVWEAVMQTFDALPLAAVLQQRVLCVHGGISPHLTSLSSINDITRPVDVNPSGAGLLVDLLWADPCTHTPGWCHSPRGVSYCFGLAAAREFMAATGVRSIVRAHMMQAEGYEVLGHHEVVTVFSAVNYRGSGNKGAVLVMDADLNMHFVTFDPPPSSPEAAAEGEAAAGAAAAAEQPQPEAAAAAASALEAAAPAAAAAVEGPPFAHGSPPSGGPQRPPLLRRTSAELVAREEVQEDSLAVRHQLPAAAPVRAGSGRLATAAAAAAVSAPVAPAAAAAAAAGLTVAGAKEDGPGGQEWRYALPPSAAAGVASVGRTASAT